MQFTQLKDLNGESYSVPSNNIMGKIVLDEISALKDDINLKGVYALVYDRYLDGGLENAWVTFDPNWNRRRTLYAQLVKNGKIIV